MDFHHRLAFLEQKYSISRRILQRARAKLSRLGLIEHVSYLNNRYGGQHGWKLSSRFEGALKQLAEKGGRFRGRKVSSKEKDLILLELMDVKRNRGTSGQFLNAAGGGRSLFSFRCGKH